MRENVFNRKLHYDQTRNLFLPHKKIITETQGAYYLQKPSDFSIQELPVSPVRMVSTYRHIRPVYFISTE